MATFVFDAWAGKTEEELKEACRELNRALSDWQHIALDLAEGRELSPDDRQRLQNLIAAYQD